MIFPEEVLLEILVRLPSKSLLRFKSVSKSWLSLINTTFFIRKHLNFIKSSSPNHCKLIFSGGRQSWEAFLLHEKQIINLDQNFLIFHLVKSHYSNGCTNISWPIDGIYLVNHAQDLFIPTPDLALWNPSIKQIRALYRLPSPTRVIQDPITSSFYETCLDNGRYRSGFGFGFDNNKFNVVCFTAYKSNRPYSHQLISGYLILGLGAKNTMEELDPFKVSVRDVGSHAGPVLNNPWGGFYYNGACHWWDHHTNCKTPCIVSFHFSDEVFRLYSMPEVITHEKIYQVTNVDGCLALICSNSDEIVDDQDGPSSSVFDVWIMTEYGVESSWFKVYNISIGGIWNFVCLVNEEFFVQEGDKRLVSYSLKTPNKGCYVYGYVPSVGRILPYHESLISVKT